MRLLMFRTAPWRDGSPAPTTKLVGRALRTLIPKLETTDVKIIPIRYDSNISFTGQLLKPLREGDNVRIRETLKNNWMKKATFTRQH